MNTKIRLWLTLLVLTAVGMACGMFDLEVLDEDGVPTPIPGNSLDTPEVTTMPATANPNTQYWKIMVDPRSGVRMAIPCFWTAVFPSENEDSTGMETVSIQNYEQAYNPPGDDATSEAIWENGGTNINLGYLDPSNLGLAPDASLENVAQAIYADSEVELVRTDIVTMNGQPGLRGSTQSPTAGEGSFYLFLLESGIVLSLTPGPNGDTHLDIMPILNSIALTPEVGVNLPTVRPANPPAGMGAECMGVQAVEVVPAQPAADSDPLTGTLDCSGVTTEDMLMWVACNVQDSFLSQNTQPLPGFMEEDFLIGYWQSEGRVLDRFTAAEEITQRMPPDTSQMSFSMNEDTFPPLLGMEPEQLVNPDINISAVVYSEGWGENREGAALLYFAQDADNRTYFYGIVFAQGHFDK